MILVADSGSTKTTWVAVESGNKIVTEGLNPHFTTDEQFLAAFRMVSEHVGQEESQQFSVYFYGAGCGDAQQRQRVERLLVATLRPTAVVVATDMLGACRAVCGDRAGLVGILGTGSNVCYFDGEHITCQPISTGYVMGDQGSANHVGRMLLNDYLTHRMPEDVRGIFYDIYQMSDAQFIDAVYHQSHPNRFLASLAPFVVQQGGDYCDEVLLTALHDWYYGPMSTVVEQSGCSTATLSVVGGFAKAIEPALRSYMARQGIEVGSVVADPMDGLIAYHTNAC